MEQTAIDSAIRPSQQEASASFPESWGAAELEAYARTLSQTLIVTPKSHLARSDLRLLRKRFRNKLTSAESTVAEAYSVATELARQGAMLSADAEWILDNYYIVDEMIRDVREHMPNRFLDELPVVTDGNPRVYEIARELIIHSDSALDESLIDHFVTSFQSGTILSIGETWALPVMLRLVLLEQLRSLAEQFLFAHRCRQSVKELLAKSQRPTHFELDQSSVNQCGPTVLELNEQLRALGEDGTAALKILQRQLQNIGWDLADLIRMEHRRQAANQVSIGNVITSMRLLGALDWIDFFESVNQADQILRRDPAGVYTEMDFASRNRYRSVIERLAKNTTRHDVEVAQAVLTKAQAHLSPGVNDHESNIESHVGYWLVGQGASEFETQIGYRRSVAMNLSEAILRHPYLSYFGLFALALAISMAVVAYLVSLTESTALQRAILIVLAIIPLSELAITIVNAVLTRIVPPRLLPKFEFENGIPEKYPTIVVVPCMLSSTKEVHNLLDRIENHYLANSDEAFRFALLTDFSDANAAEKANDKELLDQAIQGIRRLNQRYGQDIRSPFYLFHRRRIWNANEGVWMGWERKRGKLMEFGKLLQGDQSTSYIVQEGDIDALREIQAPDRNPYIITLDADTVLPRDTARRLVGTMAHPLNRPRLSVDGKSVISGYTILQPRVSVHLAGARNTRYVHTFANSPGVDPYATTASDVYQDLFAEGSFTGKGIYDLHAFERALSEAFPENLILSHDLIEGCHSRVALVSDIEVFDSYPTRYDADLKRMHRWVRGDWQIIPWLFPRVPYAEGWQGNRLSALSRWKIFDNLRRSLVAPTLSLLVIVSWLFGRGIADLGLSLSVFLLFWPATLAVLMFIINLPWQTNLRGSLRGQLSDLAKTFEQCALHMVFLLHKGVVLFDAILRTWYRMLISRKRMLQWETAAAVETRLSSSRYALWQQMWYSPVAAIALMAIEPNLHWSAILFFATWLLAPVIAITVSTPRKHELNSLDASQRHWIVKSLPPRGLSLKLT